jgi:hypothetical protein
VGRRRRPLRPRPVRFPAGAAGAGAPKGRTFCVALESDGAINVFDIWESQAEFEAFGTTLVPILAELGAVLNDPVVMKAHNVLEG